MRDTIIKKEDYKELDKLRDKIKTSLGVKTVSGYTRQDLSTMNSIYKKYGGNKSYSFTNCNSCAMKILNSLNILIENYDKRYKKQ